MRWGWGVVCVWGERGRGEGEVRGLFRVHLAELGFNSYFSLDLLKSHVQFRNTSWNTPGLVYDYLLYLFKKKNQTCATNPPNVQMQGGADFHLWVVLFSPLPSFGWSCLPPPPEWKHN